MRTLVQILGWVEHGERHHPGEATSIPTWLCTGAAFDEAVTDGYVEIKGETSMIPREGMRGVVYGLTEKGRLEFYASLPRAGEEEDVRPPGAKV